MADMEAMEVRRDREGWEAGIASAVGRLQEEITDLESEVTQPYTTEEDASCIKRCVTQIKVHIKQIRELKYPR